jgi:predicted RNA-binding protein with PUA-like domain
LTLQAMPDASSRALRWHHDMKTWLLKTEPKDCSIDDIKAAPRGFVRWDGVRNYQARNTLRDGIALGDRCLIYHSGIAAPAIVGSAEVVRAAYADPAQFDSDSLYYDSRSLPESPRWVCIDVCYRMHFPQPLTLADIKRRKGLASMVLVRNGRLSVQPVTAAEWRVIATLCGVESK